MKYIIEHLEEKVWPWCILEYKHISEIVGKNNLIFTNVPKKEKKKLEKFGKVYTRSVLKLKLKKCCLMEMIANKQLSEKDKEKFDYFVFGGILGDNPPRGRTKVLHKLNCEMRNLGKKQMSTDTAVLVAHKVLNGEKLSKIKFKDTIEIETAKNESVILPFRYVIENGKPVLAKGLLEMLKKQKGF